MVKFVRWRLISKVSWFSIQNERRQLELKLALFRAYFTEGLDPGDHAVLLQAVRDVGLDEARAQEILSSDAYREEVRAQQQFYASAGISAVPAVVINDRYLISGGQPAATLVCGGLAQSFRCADTDLWFARKQACYKIGKNHHALCLGAARNLGCRT